MKTTGPGSRSEREKNSQLSYSSCRAYAVYTNGLFPNGSASSLQQSQAVLILETSRSRGPSLAKLPCGRGQHNMRLTTRWTPEKKKKKDHLYNPRGYVLGAGCNCFPHFLRLVKLIHYQRQAGMPRAWQWACFLWAFWHFLPCNSKRKAIKLVINWCIWREKAFWGRRHSLTWLKVSCLTCLPGLWHTSFLLGQRGRCI